MQRKKHRDVTELGQGYDENDPFIDNSDVVSVPKLRILVRDICSRTPGRVVSLVGSAVDGLLVQDIQWL